jgi:hypothetical protein
MVSSQTYFRLGYQENGVKPKHNLEAVWASAKREESKVEITSLNLHFRLLGPRHKMLG